MMSILYHPGTFFCILYSYYYSFMDTALSDMTIAAARKYVLIILAMLVEGGAYSLRSLYAHVLSRISKLSLNAFYCDLAYTGTKKYFLITPIVKAIAALADSDHPKAPFLLAVDDTTIKKFGKFFYGVSTLFDHSSHEANKYVNGHCFVSVCLQVPIGLPNGNWRYLSVPVGFVLWEPNGGKTKLEIAQEMIRTIMSSIGNQRKAIIVCDSWYTKSALFKLRLEFPNLELIGNARVDTSCREYDAPNRTPGQRGRAPKHGKKLSLEDYVLTKDTLNDYHVGLHKVAVTMEKNQAVWAFVSAPKLKSPTSQKRLFLSSISPVELASLLQGYDKIPTAFNGGKWEMYSPLLIYAERWPIEVSFENMKVFWGITEYKVRDELSIPRYINLINLAYVGIVLLPYLKPEFAQYKELSPQELRHLVGEKIHADILNAERIQQYEEMHPEKLRNDPIAVKVFETLRKKFAA